MKETIIPKNTTNSIYEIIDKDKSKYDLNKYDIDHSIDFGNVDEKNMHLFKKANYLDCKKVINILDNNIKQISEFEKNEIIFAIPKNHKKSNFYFALYTLFHLQNQYKKKYDVCYYDEFDMNDERTVVICDDFIYSGSTIEGIVKQINSYQRTFFINVFGMTSKYYNLIRKRKHIRIPDNIFIADTYIDNVSTVYLFYKYPDGISSYQGFRYIIDENGPTFYYDFKIFPTIKNGNYNSKCIIEEFYKKENFWTILGSKV